MLMTVNDVARSLSVSPRLIWKLVAAGKLPAPTKLNRCSRWKRAEIEAFVAEGCKMPAQTTARRKGSVSDRPTHKTGGQHEA